MCKVSKKLVSLILTRCIKLSGCIFRDLVCKKDCTLCCVLNISVCCLLDRLAISTCKKFCAFCTATCCLLFKLAISKFANAPASAINMACLLLRLVRFIVLAIRLFSNCYLLLCSKVHISYVTYTCRVLHSCLKCLVKLHAHKLARCSGRQALHFAVC